MKAKAEYLNNKLFEQTIDCFQRSKKRLKKYELMIEDLTTAIRRKRIKNLKVEKELSVLKNNEENQRTCTQEFLQTEQLLARQFQMLSENLVRFAKFHLLDIDDALQEGVVICFEKINRFDPSKGKAFNYMTTCIMNHFRQLYRSARNYNELKKRFHEFLNFCENKIIIKNGKEIPVYSSVTSSI